MFTTITFPASPVAMYQSCGFAVVPVFDEQQVAVLERFAKDWIYRLLPEDVRKRRERFPLEKYHVWSSACHVNHGELFRAAQRHAAPDESIRNILFNEKVRHFLSGIGYARYNVWDEGLGWLAFRFIRPGCGDGYPFTRKEWGIAGNVVSAWIPIIGHSSRETITLIPGSHRKEYERHLPSDQKFRKDEYRLTKPPEDSETYRPNLKKGEAIFYHPRILHNEDVKESDVTRLNLEFRLDPVEK